MLRVQKIGGRYLVVCADCLCEADAYMGDSQCGQIVLYSDLYEELVVRKQA